MKRKCLFDHKPNCCHYTQPIFKFFDEDKPQDFNPEELAYFNIALDDYRLYQDKRWTCGDVDFPDWLPVDWHYRYFDDFTFRKIVIRLANSNNSFILSLRSWFVDHNGTLTSKQYKSLFRWNK